MLNDYLLDSAVFIGAREGFTPNASWDVNAWRIGYGSDTITFNNGTYRNVIQGDTTTIDNANKDLKRRLPKFEQKLIDAVGAKYWKRLPKTAKVGLLSYIYNYGSIRPWHRKLGDPNNLITAIQSNNVNKIADSLLAVTKDDNKGTIYYNGLQNRRKKEADMIRSMSGKEDIVKVALPIAILGTLIYYWKDLKTWAKF
jgi:GH24 family phage-related lysozyme (muramidase)